MIKQNIESRLIKSGIEIKVVDDLKGTKTPLLIGKYLAVSPAIYKLFQDNDPKTIAELYASMKVAKFHVQLPKLII